MPVHVGGLLGGAKGMLAPPSQIIGGAWPPLFLSLCSVRGVPVMQAFVHLKIVPVYPLTYKCKIHNVTPLLQEIAFLCVKYFIMSKIYTDGSCMKIVIPWFVHLHGR